MKIRLDSEQERLYVQQAGELDNCEVLRRARLQVDKLLVEFFIN
jgi:hypothetical protein